jgi:hypothetical protein
MLLVDGYALLLHYFTLQSSDGQPGHNYNSNHFVRLDIQVPVQSRCSDTKDMLRLGVAGVVHAKPLFELLNNAENFSSCGIEQVVLVMSRLATWNVCAIKSQTLQAFNIER